jgi:hypothetical protein
VWSAAEAPADPIPTPPARAVARECSSACGEGGRHAAEGLPAARIVEIASVARVVRVELPTVRRRQYALVAHALPPALGPPTSLV